MDEVLEDNDKIRISYQNLRDTTGEVWGFGDATLKKERITNKKYDELILKYYEDEAKRFETLFQRENEARNKESSERWEKEENFRRLIDLYKNMLKDKMSPRDRNNTEELFRLINKEV